jgi:hypothetical protein
MTLITTVKKIGNREDYLGKSVLNTLDLTIESIVANPPKRIGIIEDVQELEDGFQLTINLFEDSVIIGQGIFRDILGCVTLGIK